MDKKAVVKALGDHFGIKPQYMGAPSFGYQFDTPNGIYSVDKEGTVTNAEGVEIELQSLLSGSPFNGVATPSDPSAPAATGDPDASANPSESEAPSDPVASNDRESPDHPPAQEGSVDAEVPSDPKPPDASVESEAPVEPDAEHEAPPEALAEPAAPSEQTHSGITDLEVTVPLEGHTAQTLRNLVNLIFSRQVLIAKAVGFNGNIIDEGFITAIQDPSLDTDEKQMSKIAELQYLCPGITFDFDKQMLAFKFFLGEQTTETVQAYTQFVALLNHTAKKLKYASSKSKETDNDKFTFRLFLIRLGMVGDEYKIARKVLLDKLEGNSAFRSGSKPEKVVEPMEI
ncbi:hypothetical protein [Cohnella sp. AR92]|uniref:hypothetical protein n=1 Tax=Cohnella sp. AR92 TaxID=648716 RepID=UPI000F8D2AED|nr:hypothetical protein [Cohnella sp. AR92]RUS44569.1 hypothetical protein ELR57_22565 [Cohnella sp. AR92]